jgi:hypothetical protein
VRPRSAAIVTFHLLVALIFFGMASFKREPRRIPRPTVGGIEADSNPVFYMCSYLC